MWILCSFAAPNAFTRMASNTASAVCAALLYRVLGQHLKNPQKWDAPPPREARQSQRECRQMTDHPFP